MESVLRGPTDWILRYIKTTFTFFLPLLYKIMVGENVIPKSRLVSHALIPTYSCHTMLACFYVISRHSLV